MSKFQSKSQSGTRTDIEKQCPNCLRPVKKRMDFCLECGDFVVPVLSRSGRQVRPTTELPPLPPLPKKYVRKPKLKTPVMLVGGALAITLLGLFGLTVYECVNNFDSSHKDLLHLAKIYLAKGDEENAVNVLERSLLEEKQAKQEERRALLDHALFTLASKLAAQGKYRDAVTCYSRISSSYEQRDQVEKLIAEYSDKSLPVIFNSSSTADAAVGQTGKEKSASMSRLEKAVMTVVPAVQPKKNSHDITGVDLAPAIKGTASGALPALAPAINSTSSSNSSSSSGSMASTSSNPPSNPPVRTPRAVETAPVPAPGHDKEVSAIARYNELLAGYFGRHKGSADPEQTVPSYEEWVRAGSKDF
jgi:hypothetical protein